MPDRNLRTPILFSILAAVVTGLLKYLAYHWTGSVGLLSDAAESLVNLLAAVVAWISLVYASQPVDVEHTYGHEKIEYFSSGLEGLLILIAAVGIAWLAIKRLMNLADLDSIDLGLGLTAITIIINLLVARWLLRVGRAAESIVLIADGKHLMTDVWTSLGVIVGVALVWWTKLRILDPLIALAVAGNITWTGIELLRRSFDGLMDHALSAEEKKKLRAAIAANLGSNMTFHALRTRQAGARRFADFHLLVPGELSVQQAHAVANRIEDAIRAALPGIEITIHIEPIEEQESWQDSALLPIERAARDATDEPEA